MNQAQEGAGHQGIPPLLIDELPVLSEGNKGEQERGHGKVRIDRELLQHLALQGRKAHCVVLMTQALR